MIDLIQQTEESDLGAPGRIKLVREISVKVQSTNVAPGTIKLYGDRVLKFTGNLSTDGSTNFKLNKFKLDPTCRGEAFYLRIDGGAGIAVQVYDAKIVDSVLLPKGAV